MKHTQRFAAPDETNRTSAARREQEGGGRKKNGVGLKREEGGFTSRAAGHVIACLRKPLGGRKGLLHQGENSQEMGDLSAESFRRGEYTLKSVGFCKGTGGGEKVPSHCGKSPPPAERISARRSGKKDEKETRSRQIDEAGN